MSRSYHTPCWYTTRLSPRHESLKTGGALPDTPQTHARSSHLEPLFKVFDHLYCVIKAAT